MNRSFTGSSTSQGKETEKKKSKSIEKDIRINSFIRQIVIRTDEPDIPQITILKVEQHNKIPSILAIHGVERVFERIKLRKLLHAFVGISRKMDNYKLGPSKAQRLVNILKRKQKNLVSFMWLKLANLRIRQKSKQNTGRLISRLLTLSMNRLLFQALQNIKFCALSRNRRSKTQFNKEISSKSNDLIEAEKIKLKNQQFSDKFMLVVKQFSRPISKNNLAIFQSKLQPEIICQLKRFEQLRNNRGLLINNEIVLVALKNSVITIKTLNNDIEANLTLINSLQQQSGKDKLEIYKRIQKQFENADNQIKASMQKFQKIQQKDISRIIESQIKSWSRTKDVPLYTSRIFILSIISKLFKNGAAPFNQYLDSLSQLIKISFDNKRLQQFKKSQRGNQRSTSIILQITNKFIQLNVLGMQPIQQRGFSENEQIFMNEITYIKEEIRDFITKFNNPQVKSKLRKTFSTKRQNAPQQLRQLYVALNELVGLIKGIETTDNKLDIIMKIILTFKQCLESEDGEKWDKFISNEVNKQYCILTNLLESINQLVNQKIESQNKHNKIEVDKLKRSETTLKIKNVDIQKKIKTLETSRATAESIIQSETIKEKDNLIVQWQKKYEQLLQKFNNLQKTQLITKNQTKQLGDLKRKLELKQNQIKRIIEQNKKLSQGISQKQKIDQQLKKTQDQLNKQFKIIDNSNNLNQKSKTQLQNLKKTNTQNIQKLKKSQIEIKRLNKQIQLLKNKTPEIDSNHYNQLISQNQSIKIQVLEINKKLQISTKQLQQKENEIKTLKNNLIKQQNLQVSLDKSKSDQDALNRKINVLHNNIESLKRELEQKDRRIEEYQKQKRESQTRRTQRVVAQMNAQSSLQLIKQLNKQLEQLKKSEVTLEEINKSLQHQHYQGEDIRTFINRIKTENGELKRSLADKDKIIVNLREQISSFSLQISPYQIENQKLYAQIKLKQDSIGKLQAQIRDRESNFKREIQNKNDYIRKLQEIINKNGQNIQELNNEIIRLKNKQQQIPEYIKNSTIQLQRALNDLRSRDQIIAKLQTQLHRNLLKHQQQVQLLQLQNKNLHIKTGQYENVLKELKTKNTQINSLEEQLKSIEINFFNEKNKWQSEWKNYTLKNEHSQLQNTKLIKEIQQMNIVFEKLKLQLSDMSKVSINSDNMIWLLTNILTNFIRIHPKPNKQINDKTSEQIFKELIAIRNQNTHTENEMFMSLQQYVVRFVENDIGKYRYQLAIRIDELNNLKQRLNHFLNNQIQISANSFSYKYQYETKQISTVEKTLFDTPSSKQSSSTQNLMTQNKTKTVVSQQLFGTPQIRKL